MKMVECGPFVKYVGGKTQLVGELEKYVPEKYRSYHEPMVGGGALYWHLVNRSRLGSEKSYLSDTNLPLVNTYHAIRDNPERLIKSLEVILEQYQKDPEGLFYRIRERWNAGHITVARFIFLKQTAFNGLWRLNKNGEMNASWGKYKNPHLHDPPLIRACHEALRGVSIRYEGFDWAHEDVSRGDVVFYDPPYWGTFDLYGPGGFSQAEHVKLLKRCQDYTEKGVHVIYTNQDGPEMRQLLDKHWPNATYQTAGSRRMVNCDGQGRDPVDDMIVVSNKKKRKRFSS